jgi:hypothetical protein
MRFSDLVKLAPGLAFNLADLIEMWSPRKLPDLRNDRNYCVRFSI